MKLNGHIPLKGVGETAVVPLKREDGTVIGEAEVVPVADGLDVKATVTDPAMVEQVQEATQHFSLRGDGS